jgi:hypothetical protein
LSLSVLIGAGFVWTSAAPAQMVQDRARTAAEAARAKSGDSDALRQNYVMPALSGQPVTTVDNSRSFTPRISCQKSATLLEVLIQPDSTGDIGTIMISRDTDLDGSFDSSSRLPVPVSGICANGVISCEPGSWRQCHYFRWDVDTAKELKLSEGEMTDLSGCYCVNNSCGANLVLGNLATVLKDLGGGMVGALTTAFPNIGVAQARTDGPVISYVGAQTTACTSNPAVGQTAYRASPTAIQGDAAAASASNSIFQALAASAAGSGKAEQSRSCTIEREIRIRSWDYDDIVGVSGQLASVTSCGADCRRYRIQGEGNCSAAPPIFSATFDIRKPERLVSARIIGMGAEDWVQGRVNGAIVGSAGKRPWLTEALPSGDCAVDGEWRNATTIDLTDNFRSGTTIVAARVRGGKEERWGYVDVEVRVDTDCETSEQLVDLCSSQAADPHCRLQSEDVDGVATFTNGVATGLRPLPQTRLFGTASCTFQLTRDFFLRTRRYICLIDNGSPPAPDLGRAAYIIDHSTETLLADQIRTADGSLIASTQPFNLPDRGSVAACEPICKTRAPKRNTSAAPAGVVGTSQNDPVGWNIFYHSCTGTNVCPIGPGEEMMSACGCLDEFPEAVVMMQTVRLAGADLVCTAKTR